MLGATDIEDTPRMQKEKPSFQAIPNCANAAFVTWNQSKKVPTRNGHRCRYDFPQRQG
jgi:hypothetical protein